MIIRFLRFMLILLVVSGCNQTASSRYEVVQPENDKLGDLDKIKIFEDNANVLSGSAHAAIANLYAKAGRFDAAFETVHEAILHEPMNSYYHTLKSNYAFELGDISTAYREALTAYQLGSKSLQQSLILARLGVALSEYSIVDDIIDSLVIVYPNDSEVVFMAARKFEKSGQTGAAMEQYQKGIMLDPDRTDNYLHLAELYMTQDNQASAIKMLNRFPSVANDYQISLLKARAYRDIGQLDSANRYFKLLVSNHRDSVVYDELISIYRNNNMREQLTSFSVISADSFPSSKYFVRNAGDVLNERYRYDQALVYYKRLYELDTLDTLVEQEIGILQRKIAYLQRKREVERMENSIPIQKLTLPSLDSIN